MTTNIFVLNHLEGNGQQLNIDDLYEQKRQRDLTQLDLFNKVLCRIHNKIKVAARQKDRDQSCWYVVPEIVIGASYYNQSECIAYVVNMLRENKFNVRYYHPSALFISWGHWIPSYVRTEIKNKYGITVNEFGEEVVKKHPMKTLSFSPTSGTFETKTSSTASSTKPARKKFTPISEYKPTSRLFGDLGI